jgi:hypothetical protein
VGKNLHDEHVIPLSLNGAMIIKEASCSNCANITKRFEQTCARTMFGPFRLRYEMRSRHKKSRPSKIIAQFRKDDGAIEQRLIPVNNYPGILFFMKFGHIAGALNGIPEDIDVSHVADAWILKGDGEVEAGHVAGKFDVFAFARLLTKIGHCLATIELGIGGFRPLALDFMLYRHNNLSFVVGGNPEDEPCNDLHWLRLKGHVLLPARRFFAVADIRLFANLGAPTYHVAVGEVPSNCKLFESSAIERIDFERT